MVRLRVNELLDRHGLTPKELGEMAGLNYHTVLDLSKNRYDRIGLVTIDALCKALKITPADLFEFDPDK
mgnify:CR=1 FL=1